MKRDERSRRNRDRFWQRKRERVRTPADRAHLAYEVVRKRIKRIGDLVEQAAAWERLEATLAVVAEQLGSDAPLIRTDANSQRGRPHGTPTRRGVRAREEA